MPEARLSVFADTSFFIRLLKEDDPLHGNARSYYKYILDNSGILLCSTIVIAEYCVKGRLDELPLRVAQVVPFNLPHAVCAGEFARICFEAEAKVSERGIIPNDCKLLAQAKIENAQYFLTSDSRARSLYTAIAAKSKVPFQFVDIHEPANETFGILPFPS
jgi:predicted nucleic acid-binding protein